MKVKLICASGIQMPHSQCTRISRITQEQRWHWAKAQQTRFQQNRSWTQEAQQKQSYWHVAALALSVSIGILMFCAMLLLPSLPLCLQMILALAAVLVLTMLLVLILIPLLLILLLVPALCPCFLMGPHDTRGVSGKKKKKKDKDKEKTTKKSTKKKWGPG